MKDRDVFPEPYREAYRQLCEMERHEDLTRKLELKEDYRTYVETPGLEEELGFSLTAGWHPHRTVHGYLKPLRTEGMRYKRFTPEQLAFITTVYQQFTHIQHNYQQFEAEGNITATFHLLENITTALTPKNISEKNQKGAFKRKIKETARNPERITSGLYEHGIHLLEQQASQPAKLITEARRLQKRYEELFQ